MSQNATRGPSRRSWVGLLIGGLAVLVVGGVLVAFGEANLGQSLLGVGAGIIVASAGFALWTARQQPDSR